MIRRLQGDFLPGANVRIVHKAGNPGRLTIEQWEEPSGQYMPRGDALTCSGSRIRIVIEVESPDAREEGLYDRKSSPKVSA